MTVRYLDEHEERCKFCKGECGVEGMSGCIVCRGYVPMTNADRIRAMSDEEMAEWYLEDFFKRVPYCQMEACTWDDDCKVCLVKWLKQEAE